MRFLFESVQTLDKSGRPVLVENLPMPERWPASMRAMTAADYLDISFTKFRQIADREVPAIQFSDRGDRYWLREDLDAYLDRRRQGRRRIKE